MSVADAGWHRLHPLSPAVRAGRLLVAVVVIFLPSVAGGGNHGWGSAGHIGVLVLLIGFGIVSWLVTRWRVEGETLRIETGLIRRSSLRYPLAQIQAIDTVRPGLARLLGLAELRLRMAGSGGAARLAYLPVAQAEELRTRLLARSSQAPTDEPEPAEQVLVRVPTRRVVGSLVLSWPVLVLIAQLVALGIAASFSRAVASAIVSSSAVFLVGSVVTVWRGFNSTYRLTVADAHDGLRVRSGLVETTAETIPRGRVQAVRITEPLLWRAFGWCRLDVDIAGRVRNRRSEERNAGKQLRAVLPVGTRAESRVLLALIAPDAPEPQRRPPTRARWKSPLRYRWLAFDRDSAYAVSTGGRLSRSTDWVPLTKVQSLRRVQGPVQRLLGLATVHLDTAGKNVGAAFRDLDAGTAERELDELTSLARAARRAS